MTIASVGHALTQDSHPVHVSESTFAGIFTSMFSLKFGVNLTILNHYASHKYPLQVFLYLK
jgi:hypothetical protein